MGGITRSCPSASWRRGRASQAPGVSVDVVQPRLVCVRPPGKSVGAYDDLPNSSHGHALRGGRGDRGKRCPSAALCISCLYRGKGSYCSSYDHQKPFSSFGRDSVSYQKNPYGKLSLKGNHGECVPLCENRRLACTPAGAASLLSRCA